MKVACFLFGNDVALQQFAEACVHFSSQIFVRSSNAVLVEIGKSHRLFSEANFMARARVLLRRFNLSASIGIGGDIATAIAAAESGTGIIAEMPLATLKTFFDPLGANANSHHLVERMIAAFDQVGLTTVQDFLNLPAHELASRFGHVGLICRQRILGQMQTEWPKWSPVQVILESSDLGYEAYANEVDRLLFSVKPLLERMFARMRPQGLKLLELNLCFKFEKHSHIRESQRDLLFHFQFPQSGAFEIMTLLRHRIEKSFTQNPIDSAVISIAVTALRTCREPDRQRNLLNNKDQVRENLKVAWSQLSERNDKSNVFRANLTESRFAETSWTRGTTEQSSMIDVNTYVPQRPAKLLANPEQIQVTPKVVHIRRRKYKIIRWSEVEVLSGGWLDELNERKYYVIDLEGKPSAWIFQAKDETYFLHGYFG